MKRCKRLAALFSAVALLIGFASAAGGDSGDPLVSLDYLTDVFTPAADRAAQNKIDAAGETIYRTADAQWCAGVAAEDTQGWAETRLKQGDVLALLTGAQLLLLAGDVSVQYAPGGALVDATDGVVLPSGANLKRLHRYIVSEDMTAQFSVISRTAVLSYCGGYHFSYSDTTPDYNAMASALKTLKLFRGTDTGYGEGFDLEITPTRIQALVMLIRLLGEENAALQRVGSSPFSDIPANDWGAPYVAYAVEKGYTNGVGGGRFAPDVPVDAQMFVEFLLRALGYSTTAQIDVSTALSRALTAGVITGGEKTMLDTTDLLRADIAYLSWYALDIPLAQSAQPLHRKLETLGVFTAEDYRTVRARVASARL